MKITDKKTKRPVKIIQFGAGVFLRGFFDWMLQGANDAGIYNGNAMVVRSRTSGADPLEAQGFNYTHLARDASHNEAMLVDSIEGSLNACEDYEGFLALGENPDTDLIVSNTTEAGITYNACDFPSEACPESFPAKLCALLYHRYKKGLSPMLIVPCELIESNADILKEIVLRHASDWKLEKGFFDYIEGLVERGYTFTMTEFAKSVNAFLEFNHYQILEGYGKVSRSAADEKASAEYTQYNRTQKIVSDFDKAVKRLLDGESPDAAGNGSSKGVEK